MIKTLLTAGMTFLAIACFAYCSSRMRARFHLPNQSSRIPGLLYLSGIAVAMLSANLRSSDQIIPVAVLIGALCVSAASDLQFGFVFDAVSLPCIAILCICAFLRGTVAQSAAGGAACGGAVLLVYAASLGRGIGLGDLKLAVCIGLVLGWLTGLSAVGAAFVFGGFHAALLLVTKRARFGESLRFAPYLALGSSVALLFPSVAS